MLFTRLLFLKFQKNNNVLTILHILLQTIETPQMLATLQKKEAQEKVLTEKWAEKWRETQKILQEQKALGLRKAGTGVVLDSDMPHLIGIDDNLLSTGVTLYHLKVIHLLYSFFSFIIQNDFLELCAL